jgi:hypothetical protein
MPFGFLWSALLFASGLGQTLIGLEIGFSRP